MLEPKSYFSKSEGLLDILEESVKAEILAGLWTLLASKPALLAINCSLQCVYGKNFRAYKPLLKPVIRAGSLGWLALKAFCMNLDIFPLDLFWF